MELIARSWLDGLIAQFRTQGRILAITTRGEFAIRGLGEVTEHFAEFQRCLISDLVARMLHQARTAEPDPVEIRALDHAFEAYGPWLDSGEEGLILAAEYLLLDLDIGRTGRCFWHLAIGLLVVGSRQDLSPRLRDLGLRLLAKVRARDELGQHWPSPLPDEVLLGSSWGQIEERMVL